MRLRHKTKKAAPDVPQPAGTQTLPPTAADLQNPYRRFFTQTPRFEDLARRARAETSPDREPDPETDPAGKNS